MNQMQKGVLIVGLLLISVFATWPPWKLKVGDKYYTVVETHQSIKYPLEHPPRPEFKLDVVHLVLEWIITISIVLVLAILFSNNSYPLIDKITQRFPPKNSSKTSRSILFPLQTPVEESQAFDKNGTISGTVTKTADGHNFMNLKPNADYTTLLVSSFIYFSNFLNDKDKALFASWAGFPEGPWSNVQREKFALALMHHFHDLKFAGTKIPEALKRAVAQLPTNTLPPLDKPLNDDIRQIFNYMFRDA